jgi:hypothetical protein
MALSKKSAHQREKALRHGDGMVWLGRPGETLTCGRYPTGKGRSAKEGCMVVVWYG